ncbi:phosphate ABC transporter substrate-binding protein PstS [Oleiagrimonas sp. MCCC 1A03011]|uniref:phosphate ABC transporter substrate-binding protein PstS n=1 Tax=Oleiagrimonas sp. MCCC 1A03011 TaxID=1926883 RepID=UPI0019805927|nr:phosphate ABC transporter substrate-binding protein PstS [Oleiagrimonas sp. MCCC 1A03011]
MFKSMKTRIAIVVAAATLFSAAAGATDVTGAGSSFVYPVLSKWSATYAEKTGNHINYQSIGSGGGIAQIKAGTVDFGASDKPLDESDLNAHGLGQFPIVVGGIVPALNVPGIKTGQLVLDGPTLAKIFLGKIKTWNDPAIAKLNPGVKLPSMRINVVHRSDGSGTSFNFTNFLSKVSPTWKSEVGEGTAVKWPTGIGGKGNEGVSAYVGQLKGSIGYVEYAYALKNHINYALMKNAAGKTVKPDSETFSAAAATADWSHAKDFHLIMTNAPGANAWPITATTWAIMYKKPKNAANTKVVFDFFKWSYEHGQKQAESLDYVPLPDSLVKRIENYWNTQFSK